MKKLILLLLVLCLFNLSSQNVNLSNANVFEGEPYLAINPTNSKNMVVAWMGYVFGYGTALTIKVKSTFNSGGTWTSAINMPHMSPNFKSADVSMAFDASGKLFLSYIDYRESPDSGGVWVAKSLNGGLTWSAPVKVIDAYADGAKRPLDRPWLVCDNTGNNLYITTKPAPWILPPNRSYFISSNNGGATWNPWRYLDTTNFLVGSLIAAPMPAPAIAGNTVLAIYPSYVSSQNIFPQFIIASSTNGGGTFNYKTVATSTNNTAVNDSSKAGYILLVNPINTSHYVFLNVGGYTSNDLDILMRESFNAGTTWTPVKRINDDAVSNGKMQDLVWADFDTNGDLAVTWRDRRNSSGPGYARATEIYGTFRANGSASFTPNFVISDLSVPHHTILEQSGNDFMCVALKNDTLNTVWGTTRDGSLDVWFSRLKASTGGITSIKLLESESTIINTFPNPSSDVVNITTNNNKLIDLIELYDTFGKILYSQKSNNLKTSLNLKEYKSGIYQIKIYQGNLVSSKKIIKP
jgi:hypothetical protein